MIAAYNGERFIEEQIRTILDQVGVRTTIYVRDDRSSDGTGAIVDRLAAGMPDRIMRLPDAPRRFGAACENFFSMLIDLKDRDHQYFAFADQDDIWLPGKLQRAVQVMTASSAAGYASNLTAFSDADGREFEMVKALPQRRYDYLFQSASAGCTYVLDRRAVALITDRIGALDSHDWQGMSHDWLCYAICRSFGLGWAIDDWSGIRYRQHGNNQHGALPGIGGALKRLSLMRAGWYRSVFLRNRAFLNPRKLDEQAIFARVERSGLMDRLWLAARAAQFRREPTSRIALAAAILGGFF
jgi:rhamnosyltransferase